MTLSENFAQQDWTLIQCRLKLDNSPLWNIIWIKKTTVTICNGMMQWESEKSTMKITQVYKESMRFTGKTRNIWRILYAKNLIWQSYLRRWSWSSVSPAPLINPCPPLPLLKLTSIDSRNVTLTISLVLQYNRLGQRIHKFREQHVHTGICSLRVTINGKKNYI